MAKQIVDDTVEAQQPAILSHEGLRGKNLHGEAHLTDKQLDELVDAVYVDDPRVWMEPILNNRQELSMEGLPPKFIELFKRLDGNNREEIDSCINIINVIANKGDMANQRHRLLYQLAEMRIMRLVKDSVKEEIGTPANVRLLIALNGAKIFEGMFESDASTIDENQLKRIRLEDNTFAIGFGDIKQPSPEEIERVKTLIMPDDCVSTAMTQIAYLEKALKLGYRPEKVIMTFTVATYAGVNEVYRKAEELKAQYGVGFEFIMVAGGVCYSVDEAMYLRDLDGGYQVGDMGGWGQVTDFGYPNGEESSSSFGPDFQKEFMSAEG